MGITEDVATAYQSIFNVGINEFLLRVFIGLCLILFGVFLGKMVAFGLRRLSKKIEVEKGMKKSFVKLIIAVVKWSIYIIFIDLALIQLPIPGLTDFIIRILVVIPALTSALVLIAIGFGIAIYLREVIEDSEIMGWRVLSQYFFYFILYVFGVYALKIALISLDSFTSNMLIILLTAIVGIAVACLCVKKELHKR